MAFTVNIRGNPTPAAVLRQVLRLAGQLAQAASDAGASLVALYDSAGYFSTATVEEAMAELGRDRLTNVITDPGASGAIPVTKSGICSIVSAGVETRTLAAPSFAGQHLVIAMKTDGGTVTLTCATGLNQAGNTSAPFDDAGDTLVLTAIEVGSNLRWRAVLANGITLA